MDRVDELQKIMQDTATGLSTTKERQGNWAGWIIYLLEAMDESATGMNFKNDFEFTLAGLQDAITRRLKEGHW